MTQLQRIAEGVYGANTTFGLGAGIHLPLRMTVLVLDEGLALIAPIALDDGLVADLAALGDVAYILAPNLLHYAFVNDAAARFPNAKVLGAPGLRAKKPDVALHGELGTGEISPDLQTLHVQGADKLSEVVFLHRTSGTLVITDLVFNIHNATGMSKFVLGMMSRALGKVEQSRLCRWLTTDRDVVRGSIEEVLSLSFDRVVMAHGDVIERDAKAELTAGLWWMRGQRRRDEIAKAS